MKYPMFYFLGKKHIKEDLEHRAYFFVAVVDAVYRLINSQEKSAFTKLTQR